MENKEKQKRTVQPSVDERFDNLLSTFSNYIGKQLSKNGLQESKPFVATSAGEGKKAKFDTTGENEEQSCVSRKRNEYCIMDSRRFLKDLENGDQFVDPHSISNMSKILSLPEKPLSFVGSCSFDFPCENVDKSREKQSARWSMEMVDIGVKHFREKQFDEAMKCFDQSISFYPKNVDAYVARGALKANRNELNVAVKDFQEAIRLNPKHQNAKKYLVETLSNMARRFEKDMKWVDASSCYKDILGIDPSNKEALQQYSHIKQILVPKKSECQTTPMGSKKSKKPKGPLSIKSKERINRLRVLLQAETQEDSSSSSSSSSSDSDSSDDAWVEASSTQIWVEKSANDTK